ncbi:MAG: hypothetical protein WC604_03090 [Candidatus Gracilibacteria bacterium]
MRNEYKKGEAKQALESGQITEREFEAISRQDGKISGEKSEQKRTEGIAEEFPKTSAREGIFDETLQESPNQIFLDFMQFTC